MKKILFMVVATILWAGCEKEDAQGELRKKFYELIDDVDFSCSGISMEWHVSAKLNGEAICYNHSENNYKVYNGIASAYVTPGPVLNPDDTTTFEQAGSWIQFGMIQFPRAQLSHSPFIASPKEAFGMPLSQIAEKYLKIGDLSLGDGDHHFNIGLDIYCCPTNTTLPTYSIFSVSSSDGFQSSNNYLRITEVQKRETLGYIYYDISFEFQCDLYHEKGNGFNGGEYFGKLEEGSWVTQLAIPKEG